MNAMWQMWESRWSPEACDRVIGMGLQLPPVEATIGFNDSNRTDSDWRRSTIRWVDRWNKQWADVFEDVEAHFHQANHNAFGFELWRLQEMQFTEYDEESNGKYDWHQDLHWTDTKPVHRKLSMVIQLSDSENYEGGNLELRPPDLEAPDASALRNRGTILCFPSLVEHRVTPVTKGKRYSLVAWFEGPKFR